MIHMHGHGVKINIDTLESYGTNLNVKVFVSIIS
jgi:hypothetical protein